MVIGKKTRNWIIVGSGLALASLLSFVFRGSPGNPGFESPVNTGKKIATKFAAGVPIFLDKTKKYTVNKLGYELGTITKQFKDVGGNHWFKFKDFPPDKNNIYTVSVKNVVIL